MPIFQLISSHTCPFVQHSAITLNDKGVAYDTRYVDLANKPRRGGDVSNAEQVRACSAPLRSERGFHLAAIALLALLGACHSGRSAAENGNAKREEQTVRESAATPEPASDPGAEGQQDPAPPDGSLPLLGAPIDGDPVYFPISPTSIVRLDRGGWTVIWRDGFRGTFVGIDREIYVRRDEGVYRLTSDRLLPVLMFDDAEPRLSEWPIPQLAVGPGGELWFADPDAHGIVRIHAGVLQSWPDPADTGVEPGQFGGMTVDGQGRAWFPLTEWPHKYGVVHKHDSGWWERVQGWEFTTGVRGWLADAHGGLWLLAQDRLFHMTHEGIDARVEFGESANAEAIAVNAKRELVVQFADDTLLRYDADRLQAGPTRRDSVPGCGTLHAFDDRSRSYCSNTSESLRLRVLAFDGEGRRHQLAFEDRPPFHNWVTPVVVGPGPEQLPSGDAARFSLREADPEQSREAGSEAKPSPAASSDAMYVSKLREQADPQRPKKSKRPNMPPVLGAPRELSTPHYPPAKQLLLISADQPARWGQFRPAEVEYETWIVEPGSDTVERRPGIFVSDGSQLWELRIAARPFELKLCQCEEDGEPRGTVSTQVTEVALRRADRDDWQVLFGANRSDCARDSDNFREDSYLVGIAGARLLFVENSEFDFCHEPSSPSVHFRIHDLVGETIVSQLENEFPAATIDDARNRASQLAAEHERQSSRYWPHNLWLDAVIPRYDDSPFSAEVVFELRRDPDARLSASVVLPSSSSLFPPPDMSALIEQARAEAKVLIGWSLVVDGQP